MPKIKDAIIQFWLLLKTAGESWFENNSIRLGAALAFYSALSLAPLLILVITIATFLWDQESAQTRLLNQMENVLGNQGTEVITGILSSAHNNPGIGLIANLFGFTTLLFSASGVFGELQNSLNQIWGVKVEHGSTVFHLIRDRFFSFTMVVGSGFLLLISMLLSAWLAALSHFIGQWLPGFLRLMKLTEFLISLGVITLLFTLIFKIVPDARVLWKSALRGGMLTAFLFILGKIMLSLYLGHSSFASSYGAAGSLIVFLLWVYYSAQILFFGAEFTHAYALLLQHRKGEPT